MAAFKLLAGTVGFEPTNRSCPVCGGVKVRCLTAWLYPNAVDSLQATYIVYHILLSLSIITAHFRQLQQYYMPQLTDYAQIK